MSISNGVFLGTCQDYGYNRWIMRNDYIMLATEPYILTFSVYDDDGVRRRKAVLKNVMQFTFENLEGDHIIPDLSFTWFFTTTAVLLRLRLGSEFYDGDCLETDNSGHSRGSSLGIWNCVQSENAQKDGRNLWIPLRDGRYLSSINVAWDAWQCIDVHRGTLYDCQHEYDGQLVQMDDGFIRSTEHLQKCLHGMQIAQLIHKLELIQIYVLQINEWYGIYKLLNILIAHLMFA